MTDNESKVVTKNNGAISVIGNCQSRGIADCLEVMYPSRSVRAGFSGDIRAGTVDLRELVTTSDVLVVQTAMRKHVQAEIAATGASAQVIVLPTIYHTGLHPDFVYVGCPTGFLKSAMSSGHSAIAFAAWKAGLTADQAVELFSARTFRTLDYEGHMARSRRELLGEATSLGHDMSAEVAAWERSGVFLHMPNHPKMIVMAGLARVAAKALGEVPAVMHPENFLQDKLVTKGVWPIYPELSHALGVPGEYAFKQAYNPRAPGAALDLAAFVHATFETYAGFSPEDLTCTRLDDPRYGEVIENWRKHGRTGAVSSHPYKGLPDYQFWRKAVAAPAPGDLDPVTHAQTIITPEMKIATAGSCFAQHIARALQGSGFKYHVAEDGAGLSAQELQDRQFGVFSARYGNIYTAAQLDQLFDRANGDFKPVDEAWQRADGSYVDPFRPRIEPAGFSTPEGVAEAQREHFAAVRRLWTELDVFVFTLGLTEAWRSKVDGAVFPLAPGVAGGAMDFDRYEFHNFTAEETAAATASFLGKLKAINPRARVILTVSPVPLEATYEDRHVLVSTSYSKAALRVAAEQLAQQFDWVEYFPSYEIITGSYNRGAYFAEDLREVLPTGVEHVMGRFLAHHTSRPDETVEFDEEFRSNQAIICDEELLRV